MKRIPFVLLALLLSGVACSDDSEGPKKEGESDPVTLTLSDPNATEETKALYSNLWANARREHHAAVVSLPAAAQPQRLGIRVRSVAIVDMLRKIETVYGGIVAADGLRVGTAFGAVPRAAVHQVIVVTEHEPGCPGAAAALLPGGLRPRHGAHVVHSHQQSAYRRRFVGQLQQSGGRSPQTAFVSEPPSVPYHVRPYIRSSW